MIEQSKKKMTRRKKTKKEVKVVEHLMTYYHLDLILANHIFPSLRRLRFVLLLDP